MIAGDLLKVIDDIKDKPDMIILDPPRDGINPKALQKIIDFGVDKMVYISCKPTSLARDLEVLQQQGYKVEKASAVDMFQGFAWINMWKNSVLSTFCPRFFITWTNYRLPLFQTHQLQSFP